MKGLGRYVPLSEADGVRWVREPAMGRRAEVRHARLGSIWGLGSVKGKGRESLV